MKDRLQQIKNMAESGLSDITDLKTLEEFRVRFLGKKSELASLLKSLGSVDASERPVIGQLVNEARESIEHRIEEFKTQLTEKDQAKRTAGETIDVTMPGKRVELGHKHPMTIVLDELENIFLGMGFEIAEGPDIETDYYNFEALNTPAHHPAKDEQDTFYILSERSENARSKGIHDFVLRTHTSPVQVRTMEKCKPPIKIIAPGRVYRSDQADPTHTPVFHQIEGLVVDKNITLGNLKGTLGVFVKELFGGETKTRFRPHYFPFTEPSAEMDISCFVCGGKGCRVCKDSGWIEMLGCGMVHPRVLSMSGIDPAVYSGFAFGMGVGRIVMKRFNVPDIRMMFENDVNFLKQF